MKQIVNAKQMRLYDKYTQENIGINSLVLIERAAMASYDEIVKITEGRKKSILIVCGPGNNGADGFALARILYLDGYRVTAVFAGDEEHCSEENRAERKICDAYAMHIYSAFNGQAQWGTQYYDVIIDALFGVGLSRPLEMNLSYLVDILNNKPAVKVALDIPSGVSGDTGKVFGTCFNADYTISFSFLKLGNLLYPAAKHNGKVILKHVGIDEQSVNTDYPDTFVIEAEDLPDLLPRRAERTHKGVFGKLLLIAGSFDMAGCVVLAGKSALRAGVGILKIASTIENREIIQGALPEAILHSVDKDTIDLEMLREDLEWADAVAIGPGMGTGEKAQELLKAILENAKCPIVVDADALTIIANLNLELKDYTDNKDIIITPHAGEFSRLTGLYSAEVMDRVLENATDYANKHNVYTVLKDTHAVIACPNGTRY
ncbi:MAG: NAD(P)H-hydrate dehydratase, partial [Lachnospiraceae bacterium]|nr:NAD(P)H-hydrate dehydratase [Lachnospiraceae bacterium]